jgi:hypothetical protein
MRLAPVKTSSDGNPDQRLSQKGYQRMYIFLDIPEPQVYAKSM